MIELWNAYGREWVEYFGWAVAQNTAFLGLVFLVLYLLRNASARVKYAVAAVGLIKLVLPPFVPAQSFVPAAGHSIQETTSMLLFSFTNNPVGAAVPTAGNPIGLDAFGVGLLIWASAALIILTHSIVLTVRLARTVASAVPVDGDRILDDTGRVRLRNVDVYKSDCIDMPLTIGIFPRRIFVPTAWNTWAPEFRAAVLKHEMAHITRRDGFFQILEIVVQAVYFFHPLVLILNRRLREYREMACDDASIGHEHLSRLDYSKFLLELAETALRPPVACESASSLIRRKNELFKRVAYQVKEGNMHFVSKKHMAVLLTAMLIAVVPFSLYLGGGDQAVAGSKEKASKQAKVSLVLKGDQIFFSGDEVTLETFEKMTQHIAQEKGDNVIIHIDCKPDVKMSSLYSVQKCLVDANLTKVAYANGSDKALPMVLPSEDIMKKMKSVPQEDVAYLKVKPDGVVIIDEKKIKPASLANYIEKRLDDNPNLIISVHTSSEASYDDFVSVLAEVKKSGADKVIINTPS